MSSASHPKVVEKDKQTKTTSSEASEGNPEGKVGGVTAKSKSKSKNQARPQPSAPLAPAVVAGAAGGAHSGPIVRMRKPIRSVALASKTSVQEAIQSTMSNKASEKPKSKPKSKVKPAPVVVRQRSPAKSIPKTSPAKRDPFTTAGSGEVKVKRQPRPLNAHTNDLEPTKAVKVIRPSDRNKAKEDATFATANPNPSPKSPVTTAMSSKSRVFDRLAIGTASAQGTLPRGESELDSPTKQRTSSKSMGGGNSSPSPPSRMGTSPTKRTTPMKPDISSPTHSPSGALDINQLDHQAGGHGGAHKAVDVAQGQAARPSCLPSQRHLPRQHLLP